MFSKLLGNSGRKMKTAVLVNTIATISLMTTQSSVTHARLDNKKVDDKNNNDEDDKKPNDFSQWMKNIGENAKATADPSNFKNILSQERLKKISRPINEIFASGLPGEIGYGFIMGYSSGFCLRKVSKVFAFALGGVFILIQTLSYNGYVDVNYKRLQNEIQHSLDLNKDGKLDSKDLEIAYDQLHLVLSYNMPSGGGFATGFMIGLRG